ncbi:MAG: hypothetical protein QNJ03_08655 [Dinoroseobacter sp.]|nr:hypothetical protein [Dinoroseobacter sp.]
MDLTTLEAEAALAREAELLAHVAANPGARFLWFWQSPQSLVAPRKMSTLPAFDAVSEELARAGWPVSLRATGGDVTPQGPGIVNVSHVYATPADLNVSIDKEYDALCTPIEAALGPGASRGWQPGAFCDGAHNVQLNGLKFAGTAMRIKRCRNAPKRKAILAHALMLMRPPGDNAIAALNRFLSALAEPRVIDRGAHTGLPVGTDQDAFAQRLIAGFLTLPHLEPLEILS